MTRVSIRTCGKHYTGDEWCATKVQRKESKADWRTIHTRNIFFLNADILLQRAFYISTQRKNMSNNQIRLHRKHIEKDRKGTSKRSL